MVNPTAQMVLKEWEGVVRETREGVVRETRGTKENTDENNDTRIYLDIPSVQAKRKNGRIPGFGTTKYAYIKLGLPSKGRNMGVAGEESITNEAGKVELLKQVEALNNIVSEQKKKFEEQEAKINGFTNLLKLLGDKMGCELPNPEVILQSQSDDTNADSAPIPDAIHGAAVDVSPPHAPDVALDATA